MIGTQVGCDYDWHTGKVVIMIGTQVGCYYDWNTGRL